MQLFPWLAGGAEGDFLFWPGSLYSVHTAVVGCMLFVACCLPFGRLLSALSLAVNHNLTRFNWVTVMADGKQSLF